MQGPDTGCMNIRPISIGIPPKAWHSLSLFGDFLQWSNKLEEINFKAVVYRGGHGTGRYQNN